MGKVGGTLVGYEALGFAVLYLEDQLCVPPIGFIPRLGQSRRHRQGSQGLFRAYMQASSPTDLVAHFDGPKCSSAGVYTT